MKAESELQLILSVSSLMESVEQVEIGVRFHCLWCETVLCPQARESFLMWHISVQYFFVVGQLTIPHVPVFKMQHHRPFNKYTDKIKLISLFYINIGITIFTFLACWLSLLPPHEVVLDPLSREILTRLSPMPRPRASLERLCAQKPSLYKVQTSSLCNF